MSVRRVVALAAMLCLVAALNAPAGAYPRPGTIERVSISTDGLEAKGPWEPNSIGDISDDGRYVVFGGWSRNLAPEWLEDRSQAPLVRPWLFLRDRHTGVTEFLSITHDGKVSSGGERGGRITSDGRYVAFWSDANNLTPLPVNNSSQIFVRDRQTGTVEQVSVNSEGEPADAPGTFGRARSINAEITPDGRYVVFQSYAANLVQSDKWNGAIPDPAYDVFLRDRWEGTTERVSVKTGGEHVWGSSGRPKISADGRFIAFESNAEELGHAHPEPEARSVFLHDRETKTTTLVSKASDGTPDNGWAALADLSADGRYVLFASDGSNLAPHKSNTTWNGLDAYDVYVHDTHTGQTERVSVSSDGAEANEDSWGGTISDDGRIVSLTSLASNLVPGDTNNRRDAFVHDRLTGVTERASVSVDGVQGNHTSAGAQMTGDGSVVGFNSQASNLVPGIDNIAEWDVFVRDRGPVLGLRLATAQASAGTVVLDGRATFSGALLTSAETEPVAATVTDLLSASLTGASLVYRHEHESLQARLDLDAISPIAGPGVVYGVRFTTPTGTWEARATAVTPTLTRYHLLGCADLCSEEAELAGSYGTGTPQVRITIPMAAVGLAPDQTISDVEAFTALLDGPLAEERQLSSVDLEDASIPAARVIVDVLDRDGAVVGTQAIEHLEGSFSGVLRFDDLAPGDHLVRPRACLGTVCAGPPQLEMSVPAS